MTIRIGAPGAQGYNKGFDYAYMIATTAVVVGDVMAVDEDIVDATSLDWTTVQAVATADLESGILMVAMDVVAAGKVGRFCKRGKVKINCYGAIAQEDDLTGVNAKDYLDNSAAGNKIFAKPLEAETVTTTEKLLWCIFEGEYGFGYDSA